MLEIRILKYLSILTIVTDWFSEIYQNEFFLNISRAIRIVFLLYFIINFIRHFNIIRKFFLTYYYILATIFFSLYIQTDPNKMEGIWNLSKTLYWFFGTSYFYYLLVTGKINYEYILGWIKIIIVIAFGFTFYFLSIGRLEAEYNANAYLLVFIFPLFVLNINNLNKHFIFLILLLLSIIVTLKRGALLSISYSMIIALIAYMNNTKNVKFVNKIFYFSAITLFVFTFYIYLTSTFAERIEERFSEEQLDIEEDRAGSGRAGLYRRLYEEWNEADVYTYYFGHGNQADSYRIPGRRTHAHSEFFGWMYNYGLMGILLFIIQYLFIFIHFIKNYKYLKSYKYLYVIFIGVLLIVNFFSGLYRDTYTFYFFLAPVFLDLITKYNKLKQYE